MSDEENKDDWDGNDWAKELLDSEEYSPDGGFVDTDGNHRRFDAYYAEAGYPRNWRTISDRVRNEYRFRCQKCNVDLSDRTYLLHVHHLDFNKHNNEFYNLLAVCILCHSSYPGHASLLASLRPEDKLYIQEKRKENVR